MSDAETIDISRTIIPKSDQLNADQLLGGPMTITVTHVTMAGGDDQPVSVHYENEGGRPYKPCKTMRKLLVHAWGADASRWPGRSMVLFNEPEIKFGGETVGGIRISHLSDIPSDIRVSLTSTRGKKALTSVKRMEPPKRVERPPLSEKHKAMVAEFEQLAREFGFEAFKSSWASLPQADRAAIGTGERDRIGAIGRERDANPPTTEEKA